MFVPRTVTRRQKERGRQPLLPDKRKPPPERRVVVVEDFRSEEAKIASSKSAQTEQIDSEEDDEVVSFSKCQRWPVPGEPVCVECGRYGAYIIDKTDEDICSLECKARHLKQLDLLVGGANEMSDAELESGSGFCEGDSGGCVVGASVRCASGEGGEGGEGVWQYKEHPEVASWSEEHVQRLRAELSLSVRGVGLLPRPISSLAHLPFPDQILRGNLEAAGYSRLTAVQRQTIPAALQGRDLLVHAATGSGKTLSFLLPLIIRILHETTPTEREGGGAKAVILTPTRELSMQIEEQAQQIVQGVPAMRTGLVVGGLPLSNQIYRLQSGVQLVVATPARLLDILDNHAKEINFQTVEVLVLDEVDSLLQLGFEQQVRQVEEGLPAVRQKLFFSATIPPRIEKMATELLQDPLYITVGKPSTLGKSVRHTVMWVEESSKKKKLFALLSNERLLKPPVVVFVNSKAGSLLLAEAINKRCPHLACVGIHGDMAQQRRSEILKGFLEGKYSAIVATGVLARGLDLKNVQQVFIFDIPSSIMEFIHQVGRAGGISRLGKAFTFVNNENKGLFLDLFELLEPLGVQLPPQLISSPHLTAQRERRERGRRGKGRGEGGRRRKRGREGQRDFYNQDSLMDLIKRARKI